MKVIPSAKRGFSLVEVTVAITLIAAIAGIGLLALTNYQENVAATKLRNDVATLNRAVVTFQANGGQLEGCTDSSDVLSRLKSSAAADQKEFVVGLRESVIDRRITPIMMSEEEQESRHPRAVWVPSKMRFAIETEGSGVKEFALRKVVSASEIARETSLEFARVSNWIWDYSDDSSLARPGYKDLVFPQQEVPQASSGGSARSLSQLQPPDVSLASGFYDYQFFPLRVSLSNPNAAGHSRILYSFDGMSWNIYTGTAIVVHSGVPNVTLLAYCQSLDPDSWTDSLSTSASYETFTFSGNSTGDFGSPTALEGGVPVYTIEETASGGSKFSWGTPAPGFAEPSNLTFEGGSFENIVPEQEFVVGTLNFFNGTIYMGTEASGIELSVDLNLSVNVPIEGSALDFPLELINTPNYEWQDADANADYVKLSTTSTEFATSSNGTQYYLVLEFADSTPGGFTTIDEFHVWEGYSAVGTLVAKVTATPPGQEDSISPSVLLFTTHNEVNSQFQVDVEFNEYVEGFTLSDLVINNGVASSLTGNGFNFTFFVTPQADGGIALFIPSGAATDAAGNDCEGSNTLTVAADLTAPIGIFSYGSIGSLGDGSSSNPFPINGPDSVSVLFTEPVTGFSTDDFELLNGTIQSLSGAGASYTLSVTPTGGIMQLVLKGGAVIDSVGNSNVVSDAVYFQFDIQPPSITLSGSDGDVTGSFTVTAVASENIIDFSIGDITVVNGTAHTFSGTGANYAFMVTPLNPGEVSILVPASVTTDEAGNLNLTSSTLFVAYTVDQSPINFNEHTILSFGGAQDQGTHKVLSSGATLEIKDNAWKAIAFPYAVTSNTVIEFDFKSDREGEIHGIGFDSDNGISSNRVFRVYGTQNWGYSNFANYPGHGWLSYSIPVGQFYTGNFTKLVFANDDDLPLGGLGNAYFRNLRIYESITP